MPILKFPDEGFAACGRDDGKATTEDSWADFDDFAEFDEEFENFGKNESGDGMFAPLLGKTRSSANISYKKLIGMIMPETDVNIDVLEKWSDEFYPDLYCGCIEATETACFEQNIIELWGDQVRKK